MQVLSATATMVPAKHVLSAVVYQYQCAEKQDLCVYGSGFEADFFCHKPWAFQGSLPALSVHGTSHRLHQSRGFQVAPGENVWWTDQ